MLPPCRVQTHKLSVS